MYYADSSIGTIIIAVITIAASIYTSIKKSKSQQSQAAVRGQEEQEESPFFSLKSVFEEIEEELKAAAQSEVIIEEAEDAEVEATAPATVLDKLEISDNVVEEGIGVTVTVNAHPEEQKISDISQESSAKTEGLKGRLKASPKDIILYSEILKPKYKEF